LFNLEYSFCSTSAFSGASELKIDGGGLDAKCVECLAAPVVRGCVLIRDASSSGVQECFAWQEECGGKPIRLFLVLFVVTTEDHQTVVRDVESRWLMSDDEVRELVHERVRFSRLEVCGVEDYEVAPVVAESDGGPDVPVVSCQLLDGAWREVRNLLDIAYCDTHLLGDESRV
jgi:hypothetical protein